MEVTDFHFLWLVHSHVIFNLSWRLFHCFIRSRKVPGEDMIAVACGGLEDAPSHSQGRRWPELPPPPWADTSTSPASQPAELRPAGAMLRAWLTFIGDNQFLAEFAIFKKCYTVVLVCQNHTWFAHHTDSFLLHAPLWEVWLLQAEIHAVQDPQQENTVVAKLRKSPAVNS